VRFVLSLKISSGFSHGFDRCRFTHDIPSYLEAKARDIHIPDISQTSETPPFAPSQDSLVTPHPNYPSLDLSTICPVFAETGECRYGFKCRFLGGHVKISESGELSIVGDDEKKARTALTAHEVNFVGADVQKALRSRKVSV
jgi:tRNA-dihydrouridine synthase 3